MQNVSQVAAWMTLVKLGIEAQDEGQGSKAERLFRRALETARVMHHYEHPDVAVSCLYLADLLDTYQRYDEAEVFYRLAAGILLRTVGEDHALAAIAFAALAEFLEFRHRHAEALLIRHRARQSLRRNFWGGNLHRELAIRTMEERANIEEANPN